MPALPASVDHVAVVGVGDPLQGQFIDGRQSRQETAKLRQLATRLRGTYHNGNEHHLSTDLINQMTRTTGQSKLVQLTRREYALICLALSGLIFGMLPVALHFGGTHWTVGRH
jgi:Ca-activated chloride channel family protein